MACRLISFFMGGLGVGGGNDLAMKRGNFQVRFSPTVTDYTTKFDASFQNVSLHVFLGFVGISFFCKISTLFSLLKSNLAELAHCIPR
jgi:hypothetical protein